MIVDVFFPQRSRTFSYLVPEGMSCEKGQRVRAKLQNSKLVGLVVALREDRDLGFKIKPIEEVLDDGALLSDEHFALAEWLSKAYLCSPERCLSVMLPMAIEERIGDAPWEAEAGQIAAKDIELSADQVYAIERLTQHIAAARARHETEQPRISYLFGETGSGKTEVFLRTARAYIEAGMSVMYLVPEITLTHQLIEQVQSYVAGQIAVLHSGLTPSQRLRGWHRLASGDAKLVLGARSAIFAPIQNLGLIIIDEEHESSYKSDQAPRFHTRAVAHELARLHQAHVIMGSATPSLEAWKAIREGHIELLQLKRRANQSPSPKIWVVPFEGEESMITRPLLTEMQKTLAQKKQVLLFLNRRGMYSFVSCSNCDYEAECAHCSVRMTLHSAKAGRYLRCHHCDARTTVPELCPSCASLDMSFKSFGTQRIEEDLERLFADYKMIRLDSDAMRKKGTLEKALKKISAGEVDIIIGTQMIVKGLNFPGVDLVGVLQGDHMLHIPDFRAAEHTVQQLFQVAGRAGRYERQGRVIIQAFSPQAPVFRALKQHDLIAFYNEELRVRKDALLPPYRRMLRIIITKQAQSYAKKTKDEDIKLSTLAQQLKAVLDELHSKKKAEGVAYAQSLRMVGPVAPLIRFVGGKERLQILLISDHAGYAKWLCASALHLLEARGIYSPIQSKSLSIDVDVDPLDLR